jgi:hypothetical protein
VSDSEDPRLAVLFPLLRAAADDRPEADLMDLLAVAAVVVSGVRLGLPCETPRSLVPPSRRFPPETKQEPLYSDPPNIIPFRPRKDPK